MRDSYDDSPAQAREAGLRRLSRLTWRSTQIGALATVGFAILFARTAAPAANSETTAPGKSAPAALTPSHTPSPSATPSGHQPRTVGGSPGATRAKAGQASRPAQGAAQPSSAQPAPQPTAAPTTSRPAPTLAPPSSPPAPAPSTSSPAPTATSTTHA